MPPPPFFLSHTSITSLYSLVSFAAVELWLCPGDWAVQPLTIVVLWSFNAWQIDYMATVGAVGCGFFFFFFVGGGEENNKNSKHFNIN